MLKEPFCPDLRTFAQTELSVLLLWAAIWILQPLILVWRSLHCAEPAEISKKVDIRAAVFTYHTCSCCNVPPLAVRGLPLCLCGACASVLLRTQRQCQLCTCVCCVPCQCGVSEVWCYHPLVMKGRFCPGVEWWRWSERGGERGSSYFKSSVGWSGPT